MTGRALSVAGGTGLPVDARVLEVLADARLTVTVVEAGRAEGVARATDGEPYQVRVFAGGRWACSCPAASWARRGAAPCKHATALRMVTGLPESPHGD